jgi:hypothetical protein
VLPLNNLCPNFIYNIINFIISPSKNWIPGWSVSFKELAVLVMKYNIERRKRGFQKGKRKGREGRKKRGRENE